MILCTVGQEKITEKDLLDLLKKHNEDSSTMEEMAFQTVFNVLSNLEKRISALEEKEKLSNTFEKEKD